MQDILWGQIEVKSLKVEGRLVVYNPSWRSACCCNNISHIFYFHEGGESPQASLSKVVGFTLVIKIIDNCKDAVNNNVNHPPI